MSIEELSASRARFLAGRNWGRLMELNRQFDYRDQMLRSIPDHEEVVLWFEHDLYDQLQILQILTGIAALDVDREFTDLRLICIDKFAGVPDFRGLGELTAQQIGALYGHPRIELTRDHFRLADVAWRAFRSKTPTDIEDLLSESTGDLEFLQPALVRLLEQYPDPVDGCSRTERQILQALSREPATPPEIFENAESREQARFMGDTAFWWYLGELGSGSAPLVSLVNGAAPPQPDAPDFAITRLVLTENGRKVLEGSADRVALQGLERWIGGVHLEAPGSIWRWDRSKLQLTRAVVGA